MVRCAGRVDHQRFRIPDICQVRDQFQSLDKALPGFTTPLDAKAEDRPRTFRQQFLRQFMIRMSGEFRIDNPFNRFVLVQELDQLAVLFHVSLHP